MCRLWLCWMLGKGLLRIKDHWSWGRWRNVDRNWARELRRISDRGCWRSNLVWNVFPQKSPVSFCYRPGAVNTYQVTVVGTNFNDDSCLTPLLGIVAMLVLDIDMIPREEWRKFPGTLSHFLLHSGPCFCMSFLSGFGGNPPLRSGEEFSWLGGKRVSELPSKDDLGRT